MADFYRVSGNAGEVDTFYSFTGKTLKCFAIKVQDGSNGNINLSGEMGVNGAVPAILRALQANTSVLAYQVNTDYGTGNMSVLLESAEDFSDNDVRDLVRSAGNAGVITVPTGTPLGSTSRTVNVTGSDVQDNGFTLYFE
jgi:hypothetical protein